MPFPESALAKDLDAKHPDYKRRLLYWERLRKMYEGGQTMRECAGEFLFRRPMEPADVFTDRLNRFAYVNHLRTILGWYVSAEFKDPPTIILRTRNAAEGTDAIEAAKPQADQFSPFLDDCDGSGRGLTDWWTQEICPKLLLYAVAYILVDLPTLTEQPISRKAQEDQGGLRPRLVAYSPQDVIGWDTDEQGNLLWVKLKVRVSLQPDPLQQAKLFDRWVFFTQTEVAAYDAPLKTSEAGMLDIDGAGNALLMNGDKTLATLVAGYPRAHSMSDQSIVPIFPHRLHHIHWIADQISSPLSELLNQENGYNWALLQSNLAMLVIFSDEELNKVTRAESQYLKLSKDARAEFLEQSGSAFKAAAERIDSLREEIFRLAYLVAQGRSSNATATSQSGISKEQDMLPARDVLSAIGDRDRTAIQAICQRCSDLMNLDVDVDVQGLDFGDRLELDQMELIERGTTVMPITSPILEREVLKKLGRFLIPDANRELLARIDDEIDAAPTPNEQQQQQQEQQNQMQLAKIGSSSSAKLFADADAA